MEKGARLGYSNGIITLAVGAIALLCIFNGSTERLIPLYTIGVFVPFAFTNGDDHSLETQIWSRLFETFCG